MGQGKTYRAGSVGVRMIEGLRIVSLWRYVRVSRAASEEELVEPLRSVAISREPGIKANDGDWFIHHHVTTL